MKRLVIPFLLALCALCPIALRAQTPTPTQYYTVKGLQDITAMGWTFIQTTNIGITTSQTVSPGNTYSWTNTAPGGYYSNPLGVFSYGAWWVAPTLFTPLTISIGSGYTATLYNQTSTTIKAHVMVEFVTYNTFGQPYLDFNGPSVSIPPNGTAVASVPAAAYTYTKALPVSDESGYPMPLIIYIVRD